jgi:hypothetical protein
LSLSHHTYLNYCHLSFAHLSSSKLSLRSICTHLSYSDFLLSFISPDSSSA